ncbi:SDR family oxidoreductase [Longispora sp. NPDC051575]|uniref:SDR family oxidoreductase n=1 Tax=Longispora sp. NPDC051575 TaxID=3154943 RepID=UPI003428F744
MRGQWVLVLGASSGLGRAIALAAARAGANIAGVHFDTSAAEPRVTALLAELRGYGGRAELFNANAANHTARARLVAELAGLTGPDGIRVLVHSLAFGALAPFLPVGEEPAVTPRQLDMTLNVMAHSLVYWTQDLHAAGLLAPGSRIFALTSAGSSRVQRHYGAVSAAKAALESHVRQLALELGGSGVAVNALRAGVTITPALLRIPGHESYVERARATNPGGRLTTPEDVAEAVLTLTRGDSTWITGNVIGVDGGELLT